VNQQPAYFQNLSFSKMHISPFVGFQRASSSISLRASFDHWMAYLIEDDWGLERSRTVNSAWHA